MAHFYGTIKGARGEATRCGTKNSRLTTVAASWKGAIRVTLYVDDSGRDCYRVEQVEWKGSGLYRPLAEGVVGSPQEAA